MKELVALERHGRVAVLRINNPPVNALSPAVIEALQTKMDVFEADRSFDAMLVACDGRTFVAGADITMFDRPDFTTGPMNTFLKRLERSDRLVVAVVHGTALGGGLELALSCHYRVALPGTRVGLPEIKIGILPGSFGTQRVPRLAGAPFALDMMLTGRMIDLEAAVKAGLVDTVREGEPLQVGIAYLNELQAAAAPVRRNSEIVPDASSVPEGLFDSARALVKQQKAAYPAAAAVVEAVEAAVTLPFGEGEKVEARLLEACRVSPQSKALRHLFFAERQASKIPGLPKDAELRPVNKVGILGAGTMGGGIAMNFANAGIPTVLVDVSAAAVDRGLALVRRNYEASAAKGKLSAEEVSQRMKFIRGSASDADLADCDLVIEAVFEDMALKKKVCARLGEVCKPGAIIATNTSTLDVDQLAESSGRPGDFIGLHFFSPANVMRLLEVVRGRQTSPDVLATGMKVAASIRKVGVVSGVCYGFIGNRMAEPYAREADMLLLEGAWPGQIDAAIERLGMAMGPCRMLDMAGVDVAAKVVNEQDKAGKLPADPRYRAVARRLFELRRNGQKSGLGYYMYEGRNPMRDPDADAIFAELAKAHGIKRRAEIGDKEIVERLLYPLINEAAKILEEGIAYRPGDVDIVWVAGYGFPDHRGGPVFMADQIGLPKIAERLAHYASATGDPFGYWRPSKLLSQLAREKARLSDWIGPGLNQGGIPS